MFLESLTHCRTRAARLYCKSIPGFRGYLHLLGTKFHRLCYAAHKTNLAKSYLRPAVTAIRVLSVPRREKAAFLHHGQRIVATL